MKNGAYNTRETTSISWIMMHITLGRPEYTFLGLTLRGLQPLPRKNKKLFWICHLYSKTYILIKDYTSWDYLNDRYDGGF